MKKGFFPFLLLISVMAFVFLSGCLTIFSDSDDSSNNETVFDVLNLYELNIFVPILDGEEKVVGSGSYFVDKNSSKIQVVRVIQNQKEISLLKDDGFFSFEEPKYEDVCFITSSDFSMTNDSIYELEKNPEVRELNYSLKSINRSPTMSLEENFSGVLLYTFNPGGQDKSVTVNDGAEAIQIILPENIATGNRVIGTARPASDSTEQDDQNRTVLKWNEPAGLVTVKYYDENVPFYLFISALILLGTIVAVFVWYRYKIKNLQTITKLIDDEKSGFRKQR